MTDLYARLLARTDPAWYGLADDPPAPIAALRAVVELHKPEPYWDHKPDGHQICKGCDASGYDWEWPPSPCSTIRVVADALGVKGEELIEKEERRG